MKQRDQRHRVDDLLHGALLNPLLPPLESSDIAKNSVPSLEPWGGGGEAHPERGRVVHLVPPTAPGPALSPWGGVVLVRGQEHLQRELLMPPVRP